MQERALSPVVRIIGGLLGAGIGIIALFVAFSQVRAGWGSDLRAWLAAAALLVVALGAVRLVRAAIRGTITVRGGDRERGTK
jgi:hypothetical protein